MRYLNFCCLLFALTPIPAAASNTSPGYITNVIVEPNGVALFTADGPRTAAPTCATVANRWAFQASTPAGQAQLALLLTAYALHRRASVVGRGNCDAWGDTETAEFIITND